MESAIPRYLASARTQPAKLKPSWQPPYPSYVARFQPQVSRVAMAYFGAQYPGEGRPPAPVRAALADLAATCALPDGPRHTDRASYIDENGYTTVVTIAYWDDTTHYDNWFTNAREMWLGDQRATSDAGFFIEAVRPSATRFETLFSNDRREGIAVLADGLSGEVREHGYWGGSRDRLPQAQTDPLAPGEPPALTTDGVRHRVRAQHNLCLIRSGQDWTDTDGDERNRYLDDVEPVLHAGMEFLRDEGRAIGCYNNRYMRVLGDDGKPLDKSFGMSWWRSMTALDDWARDHPTHKNIFGEATRYLSALGPAARLRLYHEVTVAAAEEQHFEYLGCHPGTGLLKVAMPENS
ncbi:phenylacetaldoxime dehydratase family protein [Saccharopolyspora sp. NPDC050389]|uniref:phenylacetaldoxime dehydratase family protein n=1 Tax=Saccharopolyspora sp. NPDC050389 TaxID=3155516 RepID=UPI0033EC92FA